MWEELPCKINCRNQRVIGANDKGTLLISSSRRKKGLCWRWWPRLERGSMLMRMVRSRRHLSRQKRQVRTVTVVAEWRMGSSNGSQETRSGFTTVQRLLM